MATRSENEKAMKAILPEYMLDEFIDWITGNMPVEDVYEVRDLEQWASDNGWIKEDEQEIILG